MAMEEHDKHQIQKTSNQAVSPAVEPEIDQSMDEGNKALVDALQVTFKLLKVLMIVAVIWYIAYGAFQVKPEEVALVKRFGKVVGTGEERELKQGLHWAWPYPIDDRIIVRKDKRSANVDFWYMMSEQERATGKSLNVGASLSPGIDSFVITGDANILHVGMIIKYRVIDAYEYISNIENAGNPDVANPEGTLINDLTSAAVIHAAGQFKVDDLLGGKKEAFSSIIKKYLDNSMRQIDCGLQLEDVLISKIEPPRQVVRDFNEVRNAAEQMHGSIQTALGDREQLLTRTAGQGYQDLIDAIQAEKKLEGGKDAAKLAEARKAAEGLLGQSSGSVQEILNTARSYKTSMVEHAKADAERLQALLPEYQKNSKVVLTRLLLSTYETSLKSVRKWYMPNNVYRLRMQIDRDPDEMKYAQQSQQNGQGQYKTSDEYASPPSMPPGPPAGGPQ
jgi:membrane protease subunit HflK